MIKVCELEYFSFLPVLSLGAVFNFVNTNRNFGKTWSIQRAAWKRAKRKGKKTLLIRRFKKEVKEVVRKMYKSSDLIKWIGDLEPYAKKTDTGNFKREGNTFYIRRGKRWDWFLQVAALSDRDALRSADDVDCDRIFFDEYTTTPAKYKAYRGDEVTDFIDLFISAKREHKVTCFFFGNRENINNPYFDYFGIAPKQGGYEGVQRYRNGSIAVMYVNNKQKERTQYDKKVRDMLTGTAYGNYLYESEYKVQGTFKRAKTPLRALKYVALDWNNVPLTISQCDGYYYVKTGVDTGGSVYCDALRGRYRKEFRLIRAQKKLFRAFMNAVSLDLVRYEDTRAFESLQPFLQWLAL